MNAKTLEALDTIRSGMSAAAYRAALGGSAMPPMQYDTAVPDDPIPFQEFAGLGIAVVFSRDGNKVDSVEFGPEFAGAINGIAIGMTGVEVEQRLGPCDRTWPMPHPNYVLIYDRPEYLRIDLSRTDERVITMYR
ncbi:hypothetical protein [Sphingomonas sp.]|uniref:hypothetical protein n=1 Tax=Sphingomonas sp. TaxID=28214 RepID=UPI003D6D05EE